MFQRKSQTQTSYGIFSSAHPVEGESRILRNKATPFGTPLRSTLHEGVETIWDLVNFRAKRFGLDSDYLGVRSSAGKGAYKWMTFGQVLQESKLFGAALVTVCKLNPGDTVGVHMHNLPQWPMTSFALASQSLVVSTVYPTFGPGEIPGILNTGNTKVVVTATRYLKNIVNAKDSVNCLTHCIVVGGMDTELQLQAKAKGLTCVTWEEMIQAGRENPIPPTPPKPHDLALICFTSGTTGFPKGAKLTHANVVAGVSSAEEHFKDVLKPDMSYLSYLPLSHSFDQVNLWSCSNLGMKIGFLSGDATTIFPDLQELKAGYFPSVPRVLTKFHGAVESKIASSNWITRQLYQFAINRKMSLLKQGVVTKDSWVDWILKSVRSLMGDVQILICGSAPVGGEILDWYRCILGTHVLEGYGQTETFACGLISSTSMHYSQPFGSNVGSPYTCCELKLIDAKELGYSVVDSPYPRGQLCMRGNNVFVGYLNDEEKTRETFQDGWLLTGDIAQFLPDGTVKIIDRLKNVYKLQNGEFVSVERIENLLQSCAAVTQCFVDLKMTENHLVAIVVPDEAAVKQFAKEHGMGNKSFEELCRETKVKDWMLNLIKDTGKEVGLNSYEIPKVIHLDSSPFTPENGLITPTFKNKRRELKKKYGSVVDQMYSVAA